jgi:anthranilate synthase component 1
MAGDIFQAVLARKIIADYNAEPLDIYRELRMMNPSPYMFFVNNGSDGILLGASPEMAVRVYDGEVEIRPIAGTRPRGFVNGLIDKNKDEALETELKTDAKELAEHMMLVDLARNDVAQVSVPGTRTVDELCTVEKYSHVQHLVSNVRGKLKPGLDCLHAYVATMNMGTLTGAPKVMAMRLLREHEPGKRGFYGGSVGYITPSGDMDTAIVIRSMELKGGKAYVSAGAGIVYDSDPAIEFNETESKAKAPLTAIQKAGGIL